MGGGDKSPHILKLDTRRKRGVNFTPGATLSTGTETSMSMQQKVQWATELIWASSKKKKKKLFPLPDTTTIPQPLSARAELSWVLLPTTLLTL